MDRALPFSAVQLRCWSRPTTTTRLPARSADTVWRAAGQHRLGGLQELRGEQVHEYPVVAAHGQPRAAAAPTSRKPTFGYTRSPAHSMPRLPA